MNEIDFETSKMKAPSKAIVVRSLHKSYPMGHNVVEVLKGVDLDIEAGEYVLVVGPSGSGKSTLLHLMAGLDRPSFGSTQIFGDDISSISDRELSKIRNEQIGFVFQFFHLLPELNARENLIVPYLLGRRRSLSRRELEDRVEELLSCVSLSHRKTHRPAELSGGEQQRLAIARALMNNPKILMADEPTGNLDTHNGEIVLDLLEKLHRDLGLTLVLVTHNRDFLNRTKKVLQLVDGMMV